MKELEVTEYEDVFQDMRLQAEFFIKKGQEINEKEMVSLALRALAWLDDVKGKTNLLELESYYNEIVGELFSCRELDE